MKNKSDVMYIPEFCAHLCLNGYCDEFDCNTCIIDYLALRDINFEIKESDEPIDIGDRWEK